ncbi:hypothetical protein ACFLRB_02300 [Acidobacteriota bacterium]
MERRATFPDGASGREPVIRLVLSAWIVRGSRTGDRGEVPESDHYEWYPVSIDYRCFGGGLISLRFISKYEKD